VTDLSDEISHLAKEIDAYRTAVDDALADQDHEES
jgi:hypothetical protein